VRILHNTRIAGLALLLIVAASLRAQSAPAPGSPLDRVQRQVIAFFAKMSDLTCTESVVQQKFRPDGHIQTSAQSKYDYLIMVQGSREDLALNESRIEAPGAPHKPLPLLVTNGFSMLLLVFHPYYQQSFRLEPEVASFVNGRMLMPVHFTHIPGTRSPAALSLRGRQYPLDLEGTAWIDQQSGEIDRMEATLANDMSDVGLRSLHVEVDYTPSTLASAAGIALPSRAVIDLETPRQHWRNTHVFTGYKSFSTAAQQATTVKVVTPDGQQLTGTTLQKQPPSSTEPH
jgi:hypothetical protein